MRFIGRTHFQGDDLRSTSGNIGTSATTLEFGRFYQDRCRAKIKYVSFSRLTQAHERCHALWPTLSVTMAADRGMTGHLALVSGWKAWTYLKHVVVEQEITLGHDRHSLVLKRFQGQVDIIDIQGNRAAPGSMK